MGKTSFSGPAFGAYGLLWSAGQEVGITSTAASTIANLTVPVGQDWYICHVMASRESTGSTALVVSLLDEGRQMARSLPSLRATQNNGRRESRRGGRR